MKGINMSSNEARARLFKIRRCTAQFGATAYNLSINITYSVCGRE